MGNDNLSIYGYDFQSKVITSLITDREFTNQVFDTLKPSYFESKALTWLCESTLSYFKEYRKLPTLDVFKVQVSNVKIELERKEIISTLKDVWKYVGSDDLDFVKNTVNEWIEIQLWKKVIYDGLDHIKSGKSHLIKRDADNVIKLCTPEKNSGLDYLKDIQFRYEESEQTEAISTGWKEIDELMGGGLPKKKMGVVIAPTGIGKSWILCHLGAAALKLGKTVLHYTLELDNIYTAQRYDSIITGISMDDLKYNVPEIIKKLNKITTGQLIIEEHPSGTLSLHGLEASIDKHILMGRIPDLVIIDYAELLEINYNVDMQEDKVLGELYKNLRGLAGLKNVALWSADQTNRGGSTKEIVEGDDVSNSFAKLFALDFWFSLSRKMKDKQNKTARLYIGKNRMGPDGIKFMMNFDTDRSKFEVYSERTDQGQKIKKDMVSDEEYRRQQMEIMYEKKQKQGLF